MNSYGRDLKLEELEGRILVIEAIAWSTMSLLFSVTKPSAETAIQFMDAIKEAIKAEGRAKSLSAYAMSAAEQYAQELLSRVSENLITCAGLSQTEAVAG